MRQAADEAAAWDGQIAIQTPHLLAGGCGAYAIWPDLLAQQIRQIDHSRVGLCLDFSQVQMAANWVGFDLASALPEELFAQHLLRPPFMSSALPSKS